MSESGDSDGDSADSDDVIQFGIRRPRRQTSYHYRGSSSLSPLQIMDQEIFYDMASDILEESTYLVEVIYLLAIIHNLYSVLVEGWENAGRRLESAIASARSHLVRIKEQIDRLLFLLSWLKSYGELAFLYFEDLSVFIRRPVRFQEIRNRTIDELNEEDCYNWYGLSRYQMRLLHLHWRIPPTFRDSSRHVYDGEACFLITLYHMVKGTPFTDMARSKFGGDPRYMTNMFNLTIEHLYFTFYNKISGTSLSQWLPTHTNLFRTLIHNALSDTLVEEEHIVEGEVVTHEWIAHHFDFDTFCIFAFLDDYARACARVGDSVRRRLDFTLDIQRAFYSGYL